MKTFDIALKDILQSFRSFFLIGMGIFAPLIITALLFFAFGGFAGEASDLPVLKLGFVNLDQPAQGQNLGEMIFSMFTDESVSGWLAAARYPDEQAALAALDNRELGVAVIIPQCLSQAALQGGQGVVIKIIQDPTLTVTPSVVRNMIQSFLDGVYSGRVAYELISARSASAGLQATPETLTAVFAALQSWYTDFQRSLFHSPAAPLVLRLPSENADPTAGGMQQVIRLIMVGQMVFFSFFTAAYAMESILREHENGTLARLYTTPTPHMTILIGKLMAVVITVLLQAIVLILLSTVLFKIRWNAIDRLAVVVFAQVLAASGMGVLIISILKNTRQAGPVIGAGLSVTGMAGGLFTAANTMPDVLTTVSKFTPQGWVMDAWKNYINNGPTPAFLQSIAIAAAIGLALFLAGAFISRRRFA